MKNNPLVFFSINNFVRGGTQRQIVRLLPHIIDEFEVHICILHIYPDEETLISELPDNVIVHQFNFKNWLSFRQWISLYACVRNVKPDMIVSSFFFSNTVTRIIGKTVNVPVITREHNTSSGLKTIHKVIDRFFSKNHIPIVAVSQEVADSVSESVRISPERFLVINNGIDLKEVDLESKKCDVSKLKHDLGLQAGTKVAIAVGRLVKQKRLLLLLEGFALFSKIKSDWRLVIVGGGWQLDSLKQRVNKLGLSNKVVFVGEVADVHCYYKIADCLISVSEKEGMSNAHLEALAHGLPVLTTRTGGTSAVVVEGETGLLIGQDTPKAIMSTLIKFTEMSADTMRQASLAHRTNFAIEETANQYKKLFNSTITH